MPYVAGRLAVTDVGVPGTNPMRKPNLLVEPLPIRFRKGIVHYANFVWLASTVNAALPVLIIESVYASMEFAFPVVGAVPPMNLGVTATPSIW